MYDTKTKEEVKESDIINALKLANAGNLLPFYQEEFMKR